MSRVFAILPVLVALVASPLRAAEPSEIALAYVKGLQNESQPVVDTLNGTLLSKYCSTVRRKAIEERLTRFGRYLRGQQYSFKIFKENREGQFAGVLISAYSKHDPLGVDIFAIGLRLDGENWKAAPLPGSFDNVDTAFKPEIEAQVATFEKWMGAERLKALRKLYAEVEAAFKERMAKAVPLEVLESDNPTRVVQAFVEACRKSDLAAAMVLLGKYGDLPTEEDRRLQGTLSRGLQGLDKRNRWRLLTSDDVVRLLVQSEPGDDLDAEVIVLTFDATEGEAVGLLRFVLLRSGKRWQIELPKSLLMADEDRLRFQRQVWREDDPDDQALTAKFPEFFEKAHKPNRLTDLKEAGGQIQKILRDGTLEELFKFVYRHKALTEQERRTAYRYLAAFWMSMQGDHRSASEGELIDVMENGDTGLLAFHRLNTASLERVKLVPLLLLKDEQGWGISPGATTVGNFDEQDEDQKKRQDELFGNYDDRTEELEKLASERLLDRFVPADPKEGEVVSSKDAAKLVTNFRTSLRDGRLTDVFDACALADDTEGPWEALKLLRNDYRGARQVREPDRQLLVKEEGSWTAVSVRVSSGGLKKIPDYHMYLVVATQSGPRIVVDVGLRYATNPGRELLNERIWKRIDAQLEEKDRGLVRSLFQGHVERCKTDYAAWEKSNKLSP